MLLHQEKELIQQILNTLHRVIWHSISSLKGKIMEVFTSVLFNVQKCFIDLKAIGSYNFFLNIEYSAFKVATLTA